MFQKYPKIKTLFKRNGNFKVIPEFSDPSFGVISKWMITEKIDGTNLLIDYDVTTGNREFYSREGGHYNDVGKMYDGACYVITKCHSSYSALCFIVDKYRNVTNILFYGEMYGPGINSGGKYRSDISYRVFDVKLVTPDKSYFVDYYTMLFIANSFGFETVPYIGNMIIDMEIENIEEEFYYRLSYLPNLESMTHILDVPLRKGDSTTEGIVARTFPDVYDYSGNRIMFKLKGSDFDVCSFDNDPDKVFKTNENNSIKLKGV